MISFAYSKSVMVEFFINKHLIYCQFSTWKTLLLFHW